MQFPYNYIVFVPQVRVQNSQYQDSALRRPDDNFLPMKAYKSLYGSVDLPANKKLGHKRAKVHGVKGVVMPGDDGKTPWKVEYRQGTNISKIDEEDCGSTNGSESGAEDKFQALCKRENEGRKEVAVGAMLSILEACGAPPTEEEQARMKARAVLRKKQRAKAKANNTHAKKRRHTTGCYLAGSEDETESSEPAVKRKCTKSAARGSNETTPVASPLEKPDCQDRKEPGTGSSRKKNGIGGAEIDDLDGCGPQALSFEDEFEDKGEKGRGAPKKDSRHIAEAQWGRFVVATEDISALAGPCSHNRKLSVDSEPVTKRFG